MTPDKCEVLVLERVSDDYENLELISEPLTEKHNAIGLDEVKIVRILRKIAVAGWIDVFRYDVEKQEYVPAEFDGETPTDELWFYISRIGIEVLKQSRRLTD